MASLKSLIKDNPQAKDDLSKLLEKSERAGYQKGYAEGKKGNDISKENKEPVEPDCYKEHKDNSAICRACTFHVSCRKLTKKK